MKIMFIAPEFQLIEKSLDSAKSHLRLVGKLQKLFITQKEIHYYTRKKYMFKVALFLFSNLLHLNNMALLLGYISK